MWRSLTRAFRTATVGTEGSHRLLVDLVPAPQILRCSTVCSTTTYGGLMNSAEHAECGRCGSVDPSSTRGFAVRQGDTPDLISSECQPPVQAGWKGSLIGL
jgi:hypothetical protein